MSALSSEAYMRRVERVVQLTRLGHSATEIAVAERITRRSVYRIRQKNGASGPNHARLFTIDELRLAAALFEDGASRAEVARSVGHSESSVERHFPGRRWTKVQAGQFRALRRRYEAVA